MHNTLLHPIVSSHVVCPTLSMPQPTPAPHYAAMSGSTTKTCLVNYKHSYIATYMQEMSLYM